MNQTSNFSDANLLAWLEAQTPEQLDETPFGVVRMNREGIVVAYCKSPDSQYQYLLVNRKFVGK